ncbi:hypothetical protein [Devosia sp.]|uniref:hypothetical protein n=1 Tax=Devosia sp. TaxID=1871048 RepID=UPI0032663AC5
MSGRLTSFQISRKRAELFSNSLRALLKTEQFEDDIYGAHAEANRLADLKMAEVATGAPTTDDAARSPAAQAVTRQVAVPTPPSVPPLASRPALSAIGPRVVPPAVAGNVDRYGWGKVVAALNDRRGGLPSGDRIEGLQAEAATPPRGGWAEALAKTNAARRGR